MQRAIPKWLRVAWICLLPLGLSFAGRIAWEKTVWTINRGPQMVGFSLMHIHPEFSIGGTLCSYLLIVWLAPALIYLTVNRKQITAVDIAMIILTLFVAVAIMTPDALFASSHQNKSLWRCESVLSIETKTARLYFVSRRMIFMA